MDALDDGNSDFFIHVDKKITSFASLDKPNVVYLKDEKRWDIRWASFEMVRATVDLIELCLETEKLYDYIILLSGQDFPIKTNSDIQQFLSDGRNCNYIEVISENTSLYRRYEKRNSLYYPRWMLKRGFIDKCIKRLYIYATGGYNYTFPLFKKSNMTGLKLYYGSQWWALQRECIQWMYSYIHANPQVMEFYASSLTPDESFFQTIFMASPYADTRKDKIVYLEWDDNNNNPKIIDKKLAEHLIACENSYLFARKFDVGIDKEALNTVISNVFMMEHRR